MSEQAAANNAILFFIKYPEKNRVKTRLQADLPETINGKPSSDLLLNLYRSFVEDILETLQITAESQATATSVIICYTPVEKSAAVQAWLKSGKHFYLQQGDDLGAKMENAFSSAFKKNYERVVIVGSDLPDLTVDEISASFAALEKDDVVLGPAEDGGYYLLGLNRDSYFPEIFADIAWSTPQVFPETIERIKEAGRSYSCLPERCDVDTMADLQLLIHNNAARPFAQSRSYQAALELLK